MMISSISIAALLLYGMMGYLSPSSAFVHFPIICQHIYILRSKFTGIIRASFDSKNELQWDLTKPTEIDSANTPPSLQTILASFAELKSGSDLRGTYAGHASSGGTIINISHIIKSMKKNGKGAILTPFAAYCFGVAFAQHLLQMNEASIENTITISIGRDPRPHGEQLADAFARGAETLEGVRVLYTGLASTPAMNEFCRSGKCNAAVMITASHLPEDRNGFKFFTKDGGLTRGDIDVLTFLAQEEARQWYDMGIVPPSSGNAGVLCSELVDFMPFYKEKIKQDIQREVSTTNSFSLSNLNIVVNPGNGAGCFFHEILQDLGVNVKHSINLTPDGTFSEVIGVPNPEKKAFLEETMRVCKECNAHIGVLFDTDADRAGFVLPRSLDERGEPTDYEPLNKNRLIALIGVIFHSASPGCTIVTDSTTSEGLHDFLEIKLGLKHVRFIRGYANVIGKAKQITNSGDANAEVAIETSGHCAMKENGYTDDGTYTAVKIIGLLARTLASGSGSLLDLINDLDELPFDEEYRVNVADGSLETTTSVFQQLSHSLKERCSTEHDWTLDEENVEGVRVRLGSGGFFMIRQSLHDPVISLQVESINEVEAKKVVLQPLMDVFLNHKSLLDLSMLELL